MGASSGSQDQWRVGEDRTATNGQPLSAKPRETVGVDPEVASIWFEGIGLTFAADPPAEVLPDYLSVAEDRQRAAVELDRLAGLRKIHWYEGGSRPPDLRVCPSHLIAMDDKVRVAHDWSSALYTLNSVLSNPPVQCVTMGDFLQLLTPGA